MGTISQPMRRALIRSGCAVGLMSMAMTASVAGSKFVRATTKISLKDQTAIYTLYTQPFILNVTSLDFGETPIRTDGVTRQIVVRNTNDETMTLELSFAVRGGFGEFTCPDDIGYIKMAPGTTRSFTVRFKPRGVGQRTDSLTFTGVAGVDLRKVTVPLTGVSLAPDVRCSPTRLDFGDQAFGTASAMRAVMVTNFGTSPASYRVSLVGAASNFTIDGMADTLDLGPGETRYLSLRFTPHSLGMVTTTLYFAEPSSMGAIMTLPLTGNGILQDGQPPLAPAPHSVVELSVKQLSFGTVLYGTFAEQSLTIRNAGQVPLQLGALYTGGYSAADFRIYPGDGEGGVLLPQTTRTVRVRCVPMAMGPMTAFLVIPHNGPGGVELVPLSSQTTLTASKLMMAVGPQDPVAEAVEPAPDVDAAAVAPPAAEEPVADQAAADMPIADEPIVEQLAGDQPADAAPEVTPPAADPPGDDQPAADQPDDAPVTAEEG